MTTLGLAQWHYKFPTDEDISPEFQTGFSNIDLVETLLNGAPIIKLGIQAEPGTKMEINGNLIIVGPTGIYELYNSIKIRSLKFISATPYLRRIIIDVIYEKGE